MRTCGFILFLCCFEVLAFGQKVNPKFSITCFSPCVTLDDLPNQATKISWKGPNNFHSSEIKPKVCLEGEYQVTYTNDGVVIKTTYIVENKKNIPTATISGDENLTCIFNCRNLKGFDAGSDYGAVWYGPNGFVQNNNSINICTPGRYIYKIFKGVCASSDTIDVKDAKVKLVADGGNNITLTCKQNVANLNPVLPSKETSFEWIMDGKIYSKQGQPKVTKKGTYIFKIKQGVCESQDTVVVNEDYEIPAISGKMNYKILCAENYALSALLSSAHDAKYEWKNENAQIISTSLNTKLPKPGKYKLKSYLERNGCMDMKTISVEPKDSLNYSIKTKNACGTEDNGEITIENLSGGVAPYSFSLHNEKDFSNQKTFNNLKKGKYTIYIKDSEGCQQTFTTIIDQNRKINWTIPEFYSFCSYQEPLMIDVSLEDKDIKNVKYLWEDGNTEAKRNFMHSTKTWVEVSTECFSKKQNIEAIDAFEQIKDVKLYTPNVFNPLSINLLNRCFKPFLAFPVKQYELRIYDRWGNLVYFTEQVDDCWDGTYKGKPIHYGMFFWQITAQLDACGNPVPWQKSGGIAVYSED